MDNKDAFQYTYCAKDQEEIKRIRKKYAAPEESKLEQLRRLDAGVTQKATVISLVLGVAGSLILGAGMSLIMSDFSIVLGSFKPFAFPIGIIIGLLGCTILCLAYPAYNRTIKKERQRIAPQILRLTDELMK